jgi:hypothetical protein
VVWWVSGRVGGWTGWRVGGCVCGWVGGRVCGWVGGRAGGLLGGGWVDALAVGCGVVRCGCAVSLKVHEGERAL